MGNRNATTHDNVLSSASTNQNCIRCNVCHKFVSSSEMLDHKLAHQLEKEEIVGESLISSSYSSFSQSTPTPSSSSFVSSSLSHSSSTSSSSSPTSSSSSSSTSLSSSSSSSPSSMDHTSLLPPGFRPEYDVAEGNSNSNESHNVGVNNELMKDLNETFGDKYGPVVFSLMEQAGRLGPRPRPHPHPYPHSYPSSQPSHPPHVWQQQQQQSEGISRADFNRMRPFAYHAPAATSASSTSVAPALSSSASCTVSLSPSPFSPAFSSDGCGEMMKGGMKEVEGEGGKKGENEETDDPCCVCLMKFEEGEEVCLTPCFHKFHTDCLWSWAKSHRVCPVCKANLKMAF